MSKECGTMLEINRQRFWVNYHFVHSLPVLISVYNHAITMHQREVKSPCISFRSGLLLVGSNL